MPTGVGGGILSNPPVKPAEGSVWTVVNGLWQAAPGAAATALDGTFSIQNTADATKQFKWSLGGNTTGIALTLATAQTTAQTLNVPNITATDTLATLGLAQTFSGAKTFTLGVVATAGVSTTNGTIQASTTGNNTATMQVNANTASTQCGMSFADAGTQKWALYKDTTNTFGLFDPVNSVVPFTVTPGIISAGNFKINLTTVSTSSTTGAFQVSGGVGVGGAVNAGGATHIFGTPATTGQTVLHVSGGNSGTNGGAALYFDNNGSVNTAIGNHSAIIGGAFDSTLTAYITSSFKVENGSGVYLTADSSGNIGLGNTPSLGGGARVVFIANATTNPTSNPTGGGILYCNAGALTYRGTSGTITVIAPA